MTANPSRTNFYALERIRAEVYFLSCLFDSPPALNALACNGLARLLDGWGSALGDIAEAESAQPLFSVDSRDEIDRVRAELECLSCLFASPPALDALACNGLSRMLDGWASALTRVADSEEAAYLRATGRGLQVNPEEVLSLPIGVSPVLRAALEERASRSGRDLEGEAFATLCYALLPEIPTEPRPMAPPPT